MFPKSIENACKINKQKYVEKKDTNKNAQTKSMQQLQTNDE